MFTVWRASSMKSAGEAEVLEEIGLILNILLVKILWKQSFGLTVELLWRIYRNVTFANTNLLSRMDILKVTCKKYDYVLL